MNVFIFAIMLKIVVTVIVVLSITACSDAGRYKKAENAPDAAREFIRASLDGDYRRAAFYLLKDSTNWLLFETQESNYERLSPQEKGSNRESSIRPVEIKSLNDSIVNYTYYHSSNPKDTTMLRIVRQKGNWLVDLKSVIKM